MYAAPSYVRLPLVRVTQQGIVPFLAENPKYSLFLELLQADKDYESLITQAWAQVNCFRGPIYLRIVVLLKEVRSAHWSSKNYRSVQGPTNNTVLAATNDAVESGELHTTQE